MQTQKQEERERDNSEGKESEKRRLEQAELEKLIQAENDKVVLEKLKRLRAEGRLLADSAMTTYFGKPAFHSYGNGNTRPTSGGVVYGQYLKSHNINPHSGENKPEFV